MTIKRRDKYFVYIVQCCDGTYYTGYTKNLERRLKEHHNSRGAKYLRGKIPIKLVHVKEYRYFKNAVRAERRIKKMRRKEKEALIRIYGKNKYENLHSPPQISRPSDSKSMRGGNVFRR